jgi:outer membrane protein assembly factor BamE
MPSEAEFVATLDNKRKSAKVPELEASEESLKQFSSGQPPTAATPAAPPASALAPAAAASYPPLEPPAR